MPRVLGTDRPRAIALVASIFLYLLSLRLPALLLEGEAPVYGYEVLFNGILALFMLVPAWLANFIYLCGAWYYWRGDFTEAVSCASTALVLGATSVLARSYYTKGSGVKIEALGPAFYVWMLAFAVLFVAAAWHKRTSTRPG